MQYRAFFSYSRQDDKLANWLWGVLDRYRTPKDLIGVEGELGPVPDKLHKIFRDRADLGSGGHVKEELQEALQASERLIVLCTPASAKSFWVNQEVETFLSQGREDRIFPVIGAGTPDSGDPETECFPPALRGKGVLAADLREIKLPTGQMIGDGKEGGRLKLIAGLLGVDLDALAKRERRRQRMLVGALAGAALVFAGVAAVAGVQTIVANSERARAQANADEALRQKGIADDNAAKEKKAREDAELFARQRDAETVKAIDNAREAERQEGLASESARRARNTLHRLFATQAWASNESGDNLAAARFALAGMRLSPVNGDLYWGALGRAMHDAGESTPPLLHNGLVPGGAFSPDGTRIVTVSADNSAKVWNPLDGRLVAALVGHKDGVISAAFSPDGARIVTASADSTVKVWSAANGRLIDTYARDYGKLISAGFSLGGVRVLSQGRNNDILVWSEPEGRVMARLIGHQKGVWSAAFSPDGARVVTAGGFDNTARVWKVSDGTLTAPPFQHSDMVINAEFSRDGSRIVSVSINGSAKIWNAVDGSVVAMIRDRPYSIINATFSPSSSRVATSGRDGSVKIWDVEGGQMVARLRGHIGMVHYASFSPNGNTIVTTGLDKTVRFWSAMNNRQIASLSGQFGAASNASMSDDGTRIVLTASDRSAAVWSLLDGHLIVALRGDIGRVTDASFSPDGAYIVTTSEDRSTLLWNAKDGQRLRTLSQLEAQDLRGSFTPVGARVRISGTRAEVLRVSDGRLIALLEGHEGEINSARISSDGALVVTASDDKTARIWRAADGAPMVTLSGHAGGVLRASFAPSGARVVTSGREGDIKIWDSGDGRLLATFSGSDRDVASTMFSADGARIVHVSRDPSRDVWATTIWDSSRLTQPWDGLARDACLNLLGPHGRTFTRAEIDSDQLLLSEWNDPSRDVCEGIPGVPSIAQLRRRAGLPAESPAAN